MGKASDEIPVPSSPNDVTVHWMSKILGCKLNPNTFKIIPNAHEGKGFLSNLLRIKCEKEVSSEKIDVLVKLIPEDEQMKTFLIAQNLDKTEILTYQEVIPRLIQVLPSLADYFCPFFYGKFEGSGDSYRSVLVLKDLKPQGYATVDFGENVTESQLDEGIDFLAKLHFAGALIEKEEGKKLNEIYKFLVVDVKGQAYYFKSWLRQSYPPLLQLLSNSSEIIQNDYKELDPCLEDLIVDVFIKSIDFPTLIHGDLWTNNILFNSDPSFRAKIIDWQILAYRDPVLDLAIFVICSLPKEMITEENVQKYLKQYYSGYQQLCTEKNVPELLHRDWSEFCKSFYTTGLSFTLVWFILGMVAFAGKDDQRLLRIFEYLSESGVVKFATSIKRN